MAKLRLAQRPIDETDPSTPPSPTRAPNPATNASSAKAALRRCTKAKQRAHDICEEAEVVMQVDAEALTAALASNQAYCDAMPLLVGEEGIRDFLACAAHGIVTGAIPAKRGTSLIYAAQVALNLLHLQGKQPHASLAPPSRPAPPQLLPPPSLEDRIEIGAMERASRFK